MEFIFELICSIIFEGLSEIIANEKIKPIYRKIALVVISIICLALIFMFLIIAIKTTIILARIFLLLITVLFMFLLIKLWVKVYNNEPLNK